MNSAPARAVKARIARHWLAGRAVPARLGEITLAPHQVEAVARVLDLLDEHGGAVLADEAGMGKTFVALAVARTFGRFAVVAPAGLRDAWLAAFERAGVAGPFVSFERLSRGHAPDEIAPFVIVDEAHHARYPRTRRYAALAQLTWGARVLLLTATPVHNRLRDLRSEIALFLGARAMTLGSADLAHFVVRRTHDALAPARRLPQVEPVRWLATKSGPAVLRAIVDLPPPVPPADGGEAHALLRLGLVRAWTSSAAALRAALARRLRQATALTAALEAGRFPTRQELGAWTVIDDALQLAFPELVASPTRLGDADRLRSTISAHVQGVRRIQDALAQCGDPDAARAEHLRHIRRRHPEKRIVAFTHYVDTARSLFGRLVGDGAVALVTAHGARIASGRVRRSEILEPFSPRTARSRRVNVRLPVELLLATDVLSEGLDLQQASVLVHLDLPWTAARLEQRLGRVRRMGSPHPRVHVYAIGPPPRARELSTVVRALQRKLHLVTALVGLPDAAALDSALGRGSTRRSGSDLASVSERVRAILETWRASTTRDDPSPAATSDLTSNVTSNVTPDASREASIAVRDAGAGIHPWQALALVTEDDRSRLVVLGPDRSSDHPECMLGFLRAEQHATDMLPEGIDSLPAVQCARAAADEWLARQQGTLSIGAVTQAPSPAHVGVLRWLDRHFAGASRHERLDVAELTARCRALVQNARGAGAEAFLAGWLDRMRANDPIRETKREIDHLMTNLEGRWPSPSGAPRSRPLLCALLVLVHRCDPDGPTANASGDARSL